MKFDVPAQAEAAAVRGREYSILNLKSHPDSLSHSHTYLTKLESAAYPVVYVALQGSCKPLN